MRQWLERYYKHYDSFMLHRLCDDMTLVTPVQVMNFCGVWNEHWKKLSSYLSSYRIPHKFLWIGMTDFCHPVKFMSTTFKINFVLSHEFLRGLEWAWKKLSSSLSSCRIPQKFLWIGMTDFCHPVKFMSTTFKINFVLSHEFLRGPEWALKKLSSSLSSCRIPHKFS